MGFRGGEIPGKKGGKGLKIQRNSHENALKNSQLMAHEIVLFLKSST